MDHGKIINLFTDWGGCALSGGVIKIEYGFGNTKWSTNAPSDVFQTSEVFWASPSDVFQTSEVFLSKMSDVWKTSDIAC